MLNFLFVLALEIEAWEACALYQTIIIALCAVEQVRVVIMWMAWAWARSVLRVFMLVCWGFAIDAGSLSLIFLCRPSDACFKKNLFLWNGLSPELRESVAAFL